MKKFIFTRFCEHLYYQNDFLSFYKDTFDKIYIFCHSSDYSVILENVKNSPKVEILPITLHKHTGNFKEGLVCKQIYNYAISISEKYVSEEEVLIYFPDDDEFLDIGSSNFNIGINRSVFFDWYLSPKMRTQQLSALEFLQQVKEKKCKGRLLHLWENPFFKDNIILLNKRNFAEFARYTVLTGFHRVVDLKKEKIIPTPNSNYFIVNHLKGIPKEHVQERVKMKLDLIADKNDWDYINCSKQYNRLFDDNAYQEWYDKLKSLVEIEDHLMKLIDEFPLSFSKSQALFLEKFH